MSLSQLLWAVLASAVALAEGQCSSPYQHNVDSLDSWEKELMIDCPESKLGALQFEVTGNSAATSHFILGLKALHNFAYQLAEFEFDRAIQKDPNMLLAYWGKALSYSQLLWNGENPIKANEVLALAPVNPSIRAAATARERAYFDSVVKLNAPIKDMPDRIADYLAAVSEISNSYPDDGTAASFVPLATLARGSVGDCAASFGPECQRFQDAARAAAAVAYSRFPNSPGVLHYGLHTHDFPNATVYEGGLAFATKYPLKVTSSCHSLHMPSHIQDRAGRFADGAHANHMSVAAADDFARSGALAMDGGPIKPAQGFKFDAGNLYHSVEYEGYELLQQCKLQPANRLLQRMGYASRQHLVRMSQAQGNPINQEAEQAEFGSQLGSAWEQATTFLQWSYRMQARQILHPLFFHLLGGLDAEGESYWRSILTSQLPMPLSWHGRTDYSHGFYSPQSDAGLWNAVGLAYLVDWRDAGKGNMPGAAAPDQTCGGEYTGCVGEVLRTASQMVRNASAHYARLPAPYESSQMEVMAMQLDAMAALVNGSMVEALEIARKAVTIDHDSKQRILPGSTSLMFMEADVFLGVLLMMADNPSQDHLQEAFVAFNDCLSALVRPNHTVCLLGRAKASERLGNRKAAAESYQMLIHNLAEDSDCKVARVEASQFLQSWPVLRIDLRWFLLISSAVLSVCICVIAVVQMRRTRKPDTQQARKHARDYSDMREVEEP